MNKKMCLNKDCLTAIFHIILITTVSLQWRAVTCSSTLCDVMLFYFLIDVVFITTTTNANDTVWWQQLLHHIACCMWLLVARNEPILWPLVARMVLAETSTVFLCLRKQWPRGSLPAQYIDIAFFLTFICVRLPLVTLTMIDINGIQSELSLHLVTMLLLMTMLFSFLALHVVWTWRVCHHASKVLPQLLIHGQ